MNVEHATSTAKTPCLAWARALSSVTEMILNHTQFPLVLTKVQTRKSQISGFFCFFVFFSRKSKCRKHFKQLKTISLLLNSPWKHVLRQIPSPPRMSS